MVKMRSGRLGVSTVAAVAAVMMAVLVAGGDPQASGQAGSVTPARFEAVPDGGPCSGGDREVVLRGLGRPIKVVLGGERGVDRTLVKRRPPTRSSIRDRWQLVWRDRCLPPPCGSPEGGMNAYDRRACADG